MGRWQFHHLLRAPHRLAFASAAFMLALSGVWWAAVNVAALDGAEVRWELVRSSAHGLLMTFSFMPLFFAGFLFTAGPRWLGRPAVPARELLPHLLPQLAGWLVFLLAVHGRDAAFGRTLGALGLGAVLLGAFGTWRRFVALLAASRVPGRVHATVLAAAGAVGLAALALAAVGVALGDAALVAAGVQIGLWGFIGLVFATVAQRMIPFFSANAAVPALDARWPLALLGVFGAVFAFEAVAGAVEALVAGLPRGWAAARAVVEFAAALGCAALAVRWSRVQNLKVRLLAMLHAGLCWLAVALALHGAAHAAAAAGEAAPFLRLAAVHAYTMGYLGSTMLAMVTRVSCGHGGRALVADDFVWRLFGGLQLALVARLAAALTAPFAAGWSGALVGVAAIGWAGVWLVWACRYGHWYGTLRPDGRPG